MSPVPDHTKAMEKNLAYYDEIAGDYDNILDQDDSNHPVREKVATLFHHYVRAGRILDFGGGTGKDLPWMIEKGYRIIFCEPSPGMLEKAKARAINLPNKEKILFLNAPHTDFSNWASTLPFDDKVDGILANFAVLNTIPDLQLLFRHLSLVIRPGGHAVLLVLKAGLRTRWKTNRKATVLSLMGGSTVSGTVNFQQQQQTFYLHTISSIQKTSAPWFHFTSRIPVEKNDFVLIHLVRK
jgi:SAM-dependent methyltransferase